VAGLRFRLRRRRRECGQKEDTPCAHLPILACAGGAGLPACPRAKRAFSNTPGGLLHNSVTDTDDGPSGPPLLKRALRLFLNRQLILQVPPTVLPASVASLPQSAGQEACPIFLAVATYFRLCWDVGHYATGDSCPLHPLFSFRRARIRKSRW